MAATAFTAVTPLQVILFCKAAIAFRGKVIIAVLYWYSFFLKTHGAKIQFLILNA